ncbi:MAG TPA: Ku protein [Rhizomicrobium sp.]|jgi:DNA end-binding protein Ku|nr:Ku protein [Rhizomicrobium sp.]
MAASRHKEKIETLPVPAGLSQRPAWQGHLRLSLVSCAVGLYKATTTTNDIAFNLINPKTGNRIRMITTDPDTGPVERSSLVKGYAVEKNNYVLFSEEDLQSVKLETTRTLDIERFVDADEIDRLYWDTPYVLMPADKSSAEAYGVIQAAMVKANRIALGRVVMHTRERLMAIEPRDHGLIATTLRMADEVVNIAEALASVPDFRQDKQMVDIALRIIEQQEGEFTPAEFTDRYEEALRGLVEEKKKGHKIRHVAEPADSGNVVDLMEALRKSLKGGGGPKRKSATITRLPKRKAS